MRSFFTITILVTKGGSSVMSFDIEYQRFVMLSIKLQSTLAVITLLFWSIFFPKKSVKSFNFKDVKYVNMIDIKNNASKIPVSLHFDERFKRPVNTSYSGIQIPTNIYHEGIWGTISSRKVTIVYQLTNFVRFFDIGELHGKL